MGLHPSDGAHAASPTTALGVLRAARDLIARDGGWTQGWYARTATGGKVAAEADAAACFCSMGALYRCAAGDWSGVHESALVTLRQAVMSVSLAGIVPFTDHPHRKQSEVVAAFDAAIKLAEAAQASNAEAKHPHSGATP